MRADQSFWHAAGAPISDGTINALFTSSLAVAIVGHQDSAILAASPLPRDACACVIGAKVLRWKTPACFGATHGTGGLPQEPSVCGG